MKREDIKMNCIKDRDISTKDYLRDNNGYWHWADLRRVFSERLLLRHPSFISIKDTKENIKYCKNENKKL